MSAEEVKKYYVYCEDTNRYFSGSHVLNDTIYVNFSKDISTAKPLYTLRDAFEIQERFTGRVYVVDKHGMRV